MNSFKDFNIRAATKAFEGDKIKIDRVLNRNITVQAYKIENSKFDKGSGKCLFLQITLDGHSRVVFTGSANLMEQIKQVPVSGFPFQTTIVRENERFEFT